MNLPQHKIAHSAKVAERYSKCAKIVTRDYTKNQTSNLDEEFICHTFEKMLFFIGWVHDMGYAWEGAEHEEAMGFLLKSLNVNTSISDIVQFHAQVEIEEHYSRDKGFHLMLRTFQYVDMTTNNNGEVVTMQQRCNEIKERFNENHKGYITACKMKNKLEEVLAEEIRKEIDTF